MRYAIIPARGGSKRIARKNVKLFLGKPVIGYTIETLTGSSLFDHVVVSTDDDEIAEVAECWGAEVPFMRPTELSDDHASTDAVLLHAACEANRLYGKAAQACCVYPVNPLLSKELLLHGLNLLLKQSASCSFPVVRYDFPIEQALVLEDGIHPRFRWPELVETRSQDLPMHYHDAGMFYWFLPDRFLASRQLFTDESVGFEVSPELCQDVNTPEDWEIAELKYLRLQRALVQLG